MSSKFYDWGATLSRSRASIFAVIGNRGVGKTYGARKMGVNHGIRRNRRYVEVVRYKSELDNFKKGYFDKFIQNGEFPDHVFKVEGNMGYVARAPQDDESPRWQPLVYFVALSQQHKYKTNTFADVDYIIFDEFLIPRHKHPGYLPNEYADLLNLMDTIIREIPGEGTRTKTLLLGNSEGILYNPYFAAWGITSEPDFGFTWAKDKDVLVHYVEPGAYSVAKAKTLVGRLAKGTSAELTMTRNAFADANDDFIADKPKGAKFSFGMVYRGRKFGAWLDESEGFYYVNQRIPKNTQQPVYAMTTDDNRVNYIMADRADRRLRSFARLYYMSVIRFDSQATRSEFLRVLNLFGVR